FVFGKKLSENFLCAFGVFRPPSLTVHFDDRVPSLGTFHCSTSENPLHVFKLHYAINDIENTSRHTQTNHNNLQRTWNRQDDCDMQDPRFYWRSQSSWLL